MTLNAGTYFEPARLAPDIVCLQEIHRVDDGPHYTGRLASDHFGLVVDVTWPDRPEERR